MHLLLPLLASVLFVAGMILIKRAGAAGVGPVTTVFLTNVCSTVAFSALWLLGGTTPSWTAMWQPVCIALLFMSGLTLTYLAIEHGDVSVAAPVFGLKVLIVASLLSTFGSEPLPARVWYAALLAAAGIALIQWTGRDHPKRVVWTTCLALSSATLYAAFDVCTQHWAKEWSTGRLVPIVFWIVGFASLALIPWVDWAKVRQAKTARLLFPGVLLVSIQAMCIVSTIAAFGDAARVNIVYALRGLWGVGLAWIVARRWGGAEASLTPGVMRARFIGAALLTAAVVLVIVE